MLSVKILSDEEFDVLPYPEARISMGVADTKIGQAFVRYTASEELNKYLIEHELEHLLGEDRDEIHHGGDGVYYKGLGNLFQGMGQSIQGAGQSIWGGLQNVGKNISGAGQSVMNMFGGGPQGQKPLEVGMQGAAGNAGRMGPQMAIPSGGPSMLPSMPNAGRMSPQISPIKLANPMNFMGSQKPMTQPQPSPSVSMPKPMASQAPQQNPMGNFQIPQQSSAIPAGTQTIRSASGAPMSSVRPESLANFSAPNIIPTSRPGVPSAPPQSEGPMGMFKDPAKLAIGAGLEGIGQFGIQTPDMPDINELPSVQQLRNFNFNSIGELDPALEEAINNDFQRIEEKEYQAFVARYKSLRPGADIESDSNFRRDLMELQRMQGARRADALAKYRFDMISKNLQISQAELQQLQSMAQMDVEMIMGQMGLDYANAQKFKDTFSRLGDTLINQGLGGGQQEEEPISA